MNEQQHDEQRVVVTDIRMPFSSMVVFLIKWTLAAIPAMAILWVVMMVFMMLFMMISGGMWGYHGWFRNSPPF